MQTIPTWRTIELSFQSSLDYRNPYQAVEAEAVFVGPGGIQIRRPAFWDGGHTWKVRFAPTVHGRWTYTLTSTDAANIGREVRAKQTPFFERRSTYSQAAPQHEGCVEF